MDHVVNPVACLLNAGEVGKAERAVIVVEFEGRNPRRICLESKDHDINHEAHVFGDVLRNTVRWAWLVRFFEGWSPSLEFAAFPRILETFLNVADAFKVLIQLLLIILAQCLADGGRVGKNCVEHADVRGRAFVLEQAIERERWVKLQRCWGCRRAPRDVGAVQHGVVFMDGGVGLFTGEHEAGHLGVASVGLGEELIEAGARADIASGSDGGAREHITGLRAVDVPFSGLFVVEAADEQQSFAEGGERFENLSEFHFSALPFCPPFFGVKAVPGERHCEPDGRLGLPALGGGSRAELERFHPREGNGNADTTEEGSPGEGILFHWEVVLFFRGGECEWAIGLLGALNLGCS